MSKFPFYLQPDSKDCGPTCLKIIAKYFGKTISVDELRQLSETTRGGTTLLNLSDMQEIKLHNAEKQKRWNWEHVQARLFNISIKSLALEQYQSVGSNFLNELKNIIITIISAKLVIEGQITLGMMLAISYIVGQLNSPIQQFIDFVRQFQDAKISLERLGDIHNKVPERSREKREGKREECTSPDCRALAASRVPRPLSSIIPKNNNLLTERLTIHASRFTIIG